ncbi:DUF927 domain-containing protein [Mannheimia haemolytica]
MTKPVKAPFVDKQPKGKPYETYIIAGSNAWDKTKQQTVLEWTKAESGYQPIILGSKQLQEIDRLKLAVEVGKVSIFCAGKLTEAEKSAICQNLAKYSTAGTVAFYDEALQLEENASGYIARLRAESGGGVEEAKLTLKNASIPSTSKDKGKNSPYIENRLIGGIRGLYRITPKYNHDTGELLSEHEDWLSDPVEVVGIGQSESEAFIMLQWTPEGQEQPHIEAMPLGDLGYKEGWKLLRQKGLKIASSTTLQNHLADHLQLSGNRQLWTITNATGWQNGAYILPNGEIIGTPKQPTLFRSQSATGSGYDVAGTVESWQNEIAANLVGNPFMMLGVAVSLSAPLLHLLNADGFGVHLFGGSTAGKTTIANIASSIYGNPDRTRLGWNATALGLMNEAAARNDGFLALDEIGQGASLKHIEQTAYALFNGVGKIQGAKEGGNRDLLRWRIMAFSTGELDLESYLAQGGIKIHAGQLVRLLNVPITQAKSYHAFSDGKAHADHLNLASKQHYGAVGREWIEWLSIAENRQNLTAIYESVRHKWLNRLPDEASPQVQRVASRFVILETALIASLHLTGWQAEECSEAITKAFNEWVNIFGLHSREEKTVIEQVNGWLLANAEGRFISVPFDSNQKISNIAGYRMLLTDNNHKEHFYVYPLAFDEAIKGLAKEQACQILLNADMLKQGREQGYKYMTKLPHKIDQKRTRCYLLYPITEPDTDD